MQWAAWNQYQSALYFVRLRRVSAFQALLHLDKSLWPLRSMLIPFWLDFSTWAWPAAGMRCDVFGTCIRNFQAHCRRARHRNFHSTRDGEAGVHRAGMCFIACSSCTRELPGQPHRSGAASRHLRRHPWTGTQLLRVNI